PRKGLFSIHGEAIDAVTVTKKAAARGQFVLFSGATADADTNGSIFDLPVPDEEWDTRERLGFEREMLGLYVSGHPLDGIATALAAAGDTPIAALLDHRIPHGRRVRVAGIVAAVDRRVTRRGEPWAVVRLEDLEAGTEILFFPAAYATAAGYLTEDAVAVITATVSVRDGRQSLLGDQVSTPDLTAAASGRPLTLTLPVAACNPHTVRALRETLQRHPGPTDLRIDLIGARGPRLLALDPRFRVTTSPALMGELKALFGPACLR
ncbi:MAG: DNA polymerase III subunit alpha, partial [Nocardia sp.]|nr:DNA polymerase III subunit alpha [Nocardia sp.]